MVLVGCGDNRPPETSDGSHAVPEHVTAPDWSAWSPIWPGGSPVVGNASSSAPEPVAETVYLPVVTAGRAWVSAPPLHVVAATFWFDCVQNAVASIGVRSAALASR